MCLYFDSPETCLIVKQHLAEGRSKANMLLVDQILSILTLETKPLERSFLYGGQTKNSTSKVAS